MLFFSKHRATRRTLSRAHMLDNDKETQGGAQRIRLGDRRPSRLHDGLSCQIFSLYIRRYELHRGPEFTSTRPRFLSIPYDVDPENCTKIPSTTFELFRACTHITQRDCIIFRLSGVFDIISVLLLLWIHYSSPRSRLPVGRITQKVVDEWSGVGLVTGNQ